MLEILNEIMPNVILRWDAIMQACLETFQLLLISGAISLIFGLLFGVILIVTKKDGILENLFIWRILDFCVNLVRSVPFIILIVYLFPYTRAIVGTSIGVKGAIFPLVVGTIPFFARQIESALAEIDPGLIEAAQSMGDSPTDIIFRVYLKEGVPAIIRATTITLIALIGYVAMVGSLGGGGLGNFAIQYGHVRNDRDIMNVVVIITLLIVIAIQAIGDYLVKKTTH